MNILYKNFGKKIFSLFILLGILVIISSCGTNNEKSQNIKIEKEKKQISFNEPKNNLEQEINSRELFGDKNNKLEQLDLAKRYLAYGDAYYKEKIFADKALNILNTLESTFIVEYLKGYAYEIKGDYDKALEKYNKLLNDKNVSKDNKVIVLNQIGHIYDLKGNIQEANKYYLEAEKLNPEDNKTLLNRGRYEARAGDIKKAELYFKKLISKTDNKHLKSELYYDLSIIEQNKNNYEEAIVYANKGILEDKDYPNNYLSIGNSYISRSGEDIDKAPEYLEKAIKLYKNNSMGYKYLGIYYYIKDDFNKAIENFEKQVEASTKDILLMQNDKQANIIAGKYDLARTYALLGDVDNSLKYLKELFSGKNEILYYSFLSELADEDGAFSKIINDDKFNKELKQIILKYKK